MTHISRSRGKPGRSFGDATASYSHQETPMHGASAEATKRLIAQIS